VCGGEPREGNLVIGIEKGFSRNAIKIDHNSSTNLVLGAAAQLTSAKNILWGAGTTPEEYTT
jgi:hypothetical protein